MNNKLDLQQIAEKLEFDLEDVEMLIEVFIESASESLDSLSQAIANKDFDSILLAAHSIKGSAANLTLVEISELAKTIELNAREKNLIEYSTLHDELKQLVDGMK